MRQFDPEGIDPPDAEPLVSESFDAGVARAHNDAMSFVRKLEAEIALRRRLYERLKVRMVLLGIVAAIGWTLALVN